VNRPTKRLARRAPLLALVAGVPLLAPAAVAGQDPQDDPRNTGLRVRDQLVFSRPDGSRVAFKPDVAVWCGPWEPGGAATPSVHVWVGGVGGRRAHWEMSAVVGDVQRRPLVRLPHGVSLEAPTGALLFAAHHRNELSSAEEEARGTITFRRARCDERLVLDFRVHATLGSEFFGGERLKVRGRFRARSAPPQPAPPAA
jgi:hypothetical protein